MGNLNIKPNKEISSSQFRKLFDKYSNGKDIVYSNPL